MKFRTPYQNRDIGTKLAQPACGESMTDPSHYEPIEKKIRAAIHGNYLGRGQSFYDVRPDMTMEEAEKVLSLVDRQGFDISDIPPYLSRVKAAVEAAQARLKAEQKPADEAPANGEARTNETSPDAGVQAPDTVI